jgi:hypothetical protein
MAMVAIREFVILDGPRRILEIKKLLSKNINTSIVSLVTNARNRSKKLITRDKINDGSYEDLHKQAIFFKNIIKRQFKRRS